MNIIDSFKGGLVPSRSLLRAKAIALLVVLMSFCGSLFAQPPACTVNYNSGAAAVAVNAGEVACFYGTFSGSVANFPGGTVIMCLNTVTGSVTNFAGATWWDRPTTTYTGAQTWLGTRNTGASHCDAVLGPACSVGAASSTPTVCINTAITDITHTTSGVTGITSSAGLPAGVSASYAANTVTITGTPTAAGTFNYTIDVTGCADDATGTITVTADNTAGAASSTPTLCINTALTDITHATTGATGISNDGVAGANGLPGGVSATWAGNTITISGTPTAAGTFNYSIPLTGGCGTVNATGTITVTAANTAGAASSAPTLCINTALTDITHATTGATGISNDGVAGANGLPGGVSATWAGNTITISGTPTAAGTFNYSIPLTGGCGTVNATGTITVTADNTAGAASSTPTLCINTALTDITHATTGATGISNDGVAGANGLPAGVSATWAGNTITISGTPTAAGTFNYSIPLTGGCGTVNATGTITVTTDNTAGAASSTPTLCISTALTDITHATTGATGISNDGVAGANGLPAGVSATWAGNTITISGTPTAAGTFNYSIPLTGGCGTVNATGTITVTADNTAGAPSSTPSLCINTALTDITHATTGATGISNDGVAGANGLPAGVSATWAGNTITISGTPTAAGTFNYSIPLTGGCGTVNATGTITVTTSNSAGVASSTPTLCISTALTNITHTTAGATGISNDGVAGANGLPGGVSATWAGNTITISGTPTAAGTFNYSIPLTGGCGAANATGTITVTANNTVGAASSTPTLCISTALTNITHTTTGATGISNDGVAGANGLPAGVSATWAGNTITISGTPTAAGTFNYSIPLTGGCGTVNATGTITVTADNTAGAASSTPTLCINTALTDITHTTTGATGISNDGVAGANGLPAGVSATWAGNTITISGTPTAAGTFNYSIPLTGGCGTVNATGTITVTTSNTAGAASSAPTLCINTALTDITHTTTGATGISNDGVAGANGLPAGVSATWAGNTITISGTPTAAGTFNYSIPMTGGCGAANATGTITVTTDNTAGAASSTPTLCLNTALTDITHTTTGATGISNDGVAGANGLPAGVSATWAGNTITISGTPTAAGTFNYSIPLTGGCGTVNATGTITVSALPTITATTPGDRCGTGTVSLAATASAGTISWYAAAAGGAALGTGSPWTTPSIAATTTYYVETDDGSCSSASRTAVVATINTIPTVTATTPGDRCGTGTVNLAATASAGTLNWYAAATGGASLGSGSPFTTPSIAATTIYYVDATDGGCTTGARTAVTATINAIPTITGTSPGSRCTAGTVSLGATASGGTINWFAAAAGGVAIGAGSPWTTPSIAATTTYYAEVTDGGCTSVARTAVTATIGGLPTIVSTTDGSRCGTGTVNIGATASAGTVNWYAAAAGGASLGTGTTFTTPSIASTTIYYAEVVDGGCTSAARTPVTATISSPPTVTTTTPGDRCGTGTVSLAATASAGTINWYAAATGGASLGTGSPWTTPSIGSTTTYYVEVVDGGCTSVARTAVTATVNTEPTITATTPGDRCGTGTVSLAATASGGTINWYAAAAGGASLGTGSPWTTPSLGATTTYYVETNDGTCSSPSRTAVIATVNSQPSITATTPGDRCGTGTVSLAATAGAGTINWYAAATGGASLGTGSPWTTPSIAATTTYYVETNDGTCSSASRTAVTATINTVPTVATTSPGSNCVSPGTVNLGATASSGVLNWYAAATGGASLGTGTSWTTPSIAATTTYYVEALDGGCSSSSRVAVVATIGGAPTVTATTPGDRCGTGTVALGATASAGTVNWYAAATGGASLGTGTSWTTPSISATTTYYAEVVDGGCTSVARTAVTATVNTQPSITVSNGDDRCGTGTLDLTAAGSSGTLNWYAAATGGAALGAGSPWTTPSISSTTTYYVEALDGGCSSASRTAVVATINAQPTVTATTPGSRCGVGTVNLLASSSSGTVSWYAAATGGAAMGAGSPWTTPSISANTTYFVEAVDGGCVSTTRTAVLASIGGNPTVSSTTGDQRCGAGTVDLQATGSSGTVTWYAAATGGAPLGTGSPWTTPSISDTTTYYVEMVDGACNSTTRVPVVAQIDTIPVVTFVLDPGEICIDAGTTALSGGEPTPVPPATGVYSGVGITSSPNFDPAGAGVGIHPITYTYTDGNGCSASAVANIEVKPLPNATFTLGNDSMCLSEPAALITGGLPVPILPASGSYSGTGVSGGVFDPSVAGVGTHTITWTYIDNRGCQNTATDDMEVLALPTPLLTLGIDSSCFTPGLIALTGGTPSAPGVGVYSGIGVAGATFDPVAATVGIHTITYTYTDEFGCVGSVTDDLEVLALPSVGITLADDTMCLNEAAIPLTFGTPNFPVGTYSGAGVDFNQGTGVYSFNPSTVTSGTHTVTYHYTDQYGCVDSTTDDMVVLDPPTPTLNLAIDTSCLSTPVLALTGGLPTAPGIGVYSGAGVVGDSLTSSSATVGTHTITYTYTDEFGCENSVTDDFEVLALPSVSLTFIDDTLCLNESPVALSGGSPSTVGTGSYSGNGVTNGVFDPGVAGVGTHEITYHYADDNGCQDSAKVDLEVAGLPVVSLDLSDDTACVSEPIAVLAGGLPSGPGVGYYSGSGVDSLTGFNPSVGVGTHSVVYNYTDENGCTNTASDDMTVLALPNVAFSIVADQVCQGGALEALQDGTPSAPGVGYYTGSGVSGGYFDPSNLTAGTHTITYHYRNEFGCEDSAADNMLVLPAPAVSLNIADDAKCINEPIEHILGANPAGGLYSGAGVVDGVDFKPELAGLGTHTLTYTFTDAQNCSTTLTDDITVHGIPVVDLGPNQEVCDFKAVTLTAPNAVDYDWSTGEISQSISTTATGVYTVVITDANNCEGTGSVTLIEGGAPDVILPDSLPVCQGVTTEYAINTYDSIVWNGDPLNNGTEYYTDSAEVVDVLVVNATGCWDRDTSIAYYVPKINVELREDTTICEKAGDVVDMVVRNPNVSLLWDDGSTDTLYQAMYGGSYFVTVTDSNGCQTEDTVNLESYCSPIDITMPNYFTPNYDEINDYMIPIEMEWADKDFIMSNIQYIRFMVYDRWGIMVHSSENVLPNWDGRAPNGLPCADGTYFWVLQYLDMAENAHDVNGFVKLAIED